MVVPWRCVIHSAQAIRESNGDWILARPSLLDGDGGYGARWLRGVARLPFFFNPADARGRIAALQATDLGEALARLCTAPRARLGLQHSREFDLGGDHALTFADYLRALRAGYGATGNSLAIQVPGWAARGFAHLCDAVYFSPFSFGHWEMLTRDNMPTTNRLAEVLGRPARAVGRVPASDAPTKTDD